MPRFFRAVCPCGPPWHCHHPDPLPGSPAWVNMAQRGEGVLAAALRHTASGKLLVAAVTHLFWDPTYPDVKALQVGWGS